ncbi:hypothetical protein COT30_04305 [Candidatus Micrarchaeota archaeon CG08_land_8_20_14_0_20_49_17]|nr:MAG: hypothetical protein COT30_04305 [Candidatus Micrarchaeota archaeon CG08_land_8_20_14_0_20_49_17]
METTNSQLLNAASVGDLETAEALLEAGANVNICNPYGQTALHLAAEWGYTETAKALLEADGVDIDVIDRSGETALDLATIWNHMETAAVLSAAGAMEKRAKQRETTKAGDGYSKSRAEAQFRNGPPAPLHRRVHAQYTRQPRKDMSVC